MIIVIYEYCCTCVHSTLYTVRLYNNPQTLFTRNKRVNSSPNSNLPIGYTPGDVHYTVKCTPYTVHVYTMTLKHYLLEMGLMVLQMAACLPGAHQVPGDVHFTVM